MHEFEAHTLRMFGWCIIPPSLFKQRCPWCVAFLYGILVSSLSTTMGHVATTWNWQGNWYLYCSYWEKDLPDVLNIYQDLDFPELCFIRLYNEEISRRPRPIVEGQAWYLQTKALKRTKSEIQREIPVKYRKEFELGRMGHNKVGSLFKNFSVR